MITPEQHREIEARLERNRAPKITVTKCTGILAVAVAAVARSVKAKQSGSIRILLDFWASEGVPEPHTEFIFHPQRKWRFDFCWGAFGIGPMIYLEVQGGTWRKGGGAHRGKGAIRDMKKFSEATILGWRPLFCQPSELLTVETAQMIKRALGLVK